MPLPKYHQIYLVLRDQLSNGWHQQGLPSELRLTQSFGVGRVTVRRALSQLADEGLITREPGRGTRPKLDHAQRWVGLDMQARPEQAQLNGLLESVVTLSLKTSVRVLSLQLCIQPPPNVREVLMLTAGERVHKVVRLRSSSRGPLSHITAFVPEKCVPQFSPADLCSKPMLKLIQEAGCELGGLRQTVSATSASVDLSQALDLAVGSPLLSVQRLVYDKSQQPLQWLLGLHRPDRYVYHMDVPQTGGTQARIWMDEAAVT